MNKETYKAKLIRNKFKKNIFKHLIKLLSLKQLSLSLREYIILTGGDVKYFAIYIVSTQEKGAKRTMRRTLMFSF